MASEFILYKVRDIIESVRFLILSYSLPELYAITSPKTLHPNEIGRRTVKCLHLDIWTFIHQN